jgi:hypothetical protein
MSVNQILRVLRPNIALDDISEAPEMPNVELDRDNPTLDWTGSGLEEYGDD